MAAVLYLDTSAVLRAVLEPGLSPDAERRIGEARVLITSRLALVESARALLRIRQDGRLSEEALADAAREIDAVWARCAVWELTRPVCEFAAQVAPLKALRALDALHLATYLLARRRLGDEVELLTMDRRLAEAAASI
ncbi:MAG TPA: type II toxin-antitoxin system VapC family toxin [Longimicrobiales bacterium]|nr:type II toxin-antitoxin system VapC family toxin [Longimicrobiales bacterium]